MFSRNCSQNICVSEYSAGFYVSEEKILYIFPVLSRERILKTKKQRNNYLNKKINVQIIVSLFLKSPPSALKTSFLLKLRSSSVYSLILIDPNRRSALLYLRVQACIDYVARPADLGICKIKAFSFHFITGKIKFRNNSRKSGRKRNSNKGSRPKKITFLADMSAKVFSPPPKPYRIYEQKVSFMYTNIFFSS